MDLSNMPDWQINQLMNQGAISPETGYEIKRRRQASQPAPGETPLSPSAPFQGPTTGLGQDPSQAWKPPPTPEPSGYALDVNRGAPPAPSSSPVPSPAGGGTADTASAAPSPDGESPLDAAMRIQGKLEGAAGRVAQHAKEAQDAQDKATQKAKEAIDEQTALAMDKAQSEAKLQQDEAQRQKAQLAQDNEERANREMYLQSAANDLRSLEKRAADYQIDPDRRSMGAKVMGAIAVALGSYAAAWNGGRNTAADLVRQSIEDDIQAQRDELQNRRGAAAAKQNELATLYQRYGSMDRAADARRLQLNAEAKARIDAVMSEYAAPEKQAEAERLKAQLDASSAESRTRLLQSFDRDYTQALTGAGTLAERTFAAERRPGGIGNKVLPAAEAAKIADKMSALDMIAGLEKDFGAMTGPASAVTRHFDASKSAQFDVRRQNFANELTTKMFGTRASNQERENILKLVPASSDYSGSEAPNKFRTLRQSAIEKLRNEIDSARAAGFDVSRYEPLLRRFDSTQQAAALGGTPHGG